MTAKKKGPAGIELALNAVEASCKALRLLLSGPVEDPAPTPAITRIWLSLRDAHQSYGVAQTTLRRAARNGEIVASRVDKKLVLRTDSVAAYVEARTIAPLRPTHSEGAGPHDELDRALRNARRQR